MAVERSTGQMVSTVRIFRRTVRLGCKLVDVGGIGEVSTLPVCYACIARTVQIFS